MRVDKMTLFADLGYEPHPGQLLIHNSTARRRIAACGVRFGKTTCAAYECIAECLAPRERGVGWIVAPTFDLADRVFEEVERIALKKLSRFVKQYLRSEKRLVFTNLGGGTTEFRAKSADNPVSLLGEGLDFLVVDEAARLPPRVWQSHLAQRLIDRKGWALLISTPHGRGWLYDMYRMGQGANRNPNYESWNLPSWTNPRLDREEIRREKLTMPERIFAQEYGAKFMEGSGAVFRHVRERATGQWEDPVYREEYFAGLDLAKVDDFSVLVIMDRRGKVVYVDRFHRISWDAQAARVADATSYYNHARIMCDVTGLGDPVKELLEKHNCYVTPFPFTQRSKAQLIDNLTMLLDQKAVVLPRPQLWPEGIEELEAYEYSMSEQGNIRSGAPSGMHDDCVIAVALAAYNMSRPRPNVRFAVIRRGR